MMKRVTPLPHTADAGRHAAYTGYITALPTPFDAEDHVDGETFQAFCEWQIHQGAAGLVVCGTTGESPTLSEGEHRRLIQRAVRTVRHRVPVIAGTGSNSTREAVERARAAEEAGADALLVVVPYYNRPSQEGLYRHFAAVAASVAIPVILYDVPARTGCGLSIDTIVRLGEIPNIIGLKDATGDLSRVAILRGRLGPDFRLLSGDDATALGHLALGGDGCISVTSNVAPKLCGRLYDAVASGDQREAQAIALALAPLTASLFSDSNPVPVKYALSLMQRMPAWVRLPLCEPSAEARRAVSTALSHLGLLPQAAKATGKRAA